MKTSERCKIWQILGNIDTCQEELNKAIEEQNFDKIKACSQYLAKIRERLDKLADEDLI